MNNMTLNSEICNHRPCLESFALNFTRNIDDANDLVQDTIIKAIRYHDLYKEGTNFKGWLYTIMKNTFINDYRKKQFRRGIVDTTEQLSYVQLKQSANKNLGEDKFLLQDITKAFEHLDEVYSVPFLRYFEGYKYHEIAEELQIPLGTVKTRIHFARQILKSQLKMYNDQFNRHTKLAR